jgi:hypothetical protein
MPAVTGYITRSNLPSPLSDLAINVDPLWLLSGDASDDASVSRSAGYTPGPSQLKRVWADSPFVAGQQQVLATPDNSTLDLRLLIDGANETAIATSAGLVITAVTKQQTFQVSYTAGSVTWTRNCYTGVFQVAFNQLHLFGGRLPLYVSMPCDPTPVAGPF